MTELHGKKKLRYKQIPFLAGVNLLYFYIIYSWIHFV